MSPHSFEALLLSDSIYCRNYHCPVPNNNTFRLIPSRCDLIESLTEQRHDFSGVNRLSTSLYKCTDKLFCAYPSLRNPSTNLILSEWAQSIKSHIFHKSAAYYDLIEHHSGTKDIHKHEYFNKSRSYARQLSKSILFNWQLAYIITVEDLVNSISSREFLNSAQPSKLLFIDLIPPKSEKYNTKNYCFVQMYLSSLLRLEEVQQIAHVVASGSRLLHTKLQSSDGYTDLILPGMSIQQGFNGLKSLLRCLGLLAIYYAPTPGFYYAKSY
jgi:hypothetical protein